MITWTVGKVIFYLWASSVIPDGFTKVDCPQYGYKCIVQISEVDV